MQCVPKTSEDDLESIYRSLPDTNYVEYLTDLLIPAEFGTTNEIIEMLNKGEIATETTYG